MESNHRDTYRLEELGIQNTLDLDLFSETVLSNSFSVSVLLEVNQIKFVSEEEDSLVGRCGSRKFCWLLFLGVIPSHGSSEQWAEQLFNYRQLYYKKMAAVKLFKEAMQKKQAEMQTLVNLRWNADSSSGPAERMDPGDQQVVNDKELRELVTQDVDRTLQEVPLFTNSVVKGQLEDLLYLWARDNGEFGYRQGMNEVLAILVVAFFQEASADGD